jgi:hypothetical protein
MDRTGFRRRRIRIFVIVPYVSGSFDGVPIGITALFPAAGMRKNDPDRLLLLYGELHRSRWLSRLMEDRVTHEQ